ncbi:hypothetical protein MPUL_00110 [Mycolicibacterium pulveris]|uniref:Uncharacterized protein n=1 Tax=Mycolicibacterium pulveris TaxID=36813 RepID=A0A7I7UD52_MYCPV|nr:hypothetical protein [Mycolicibacterium pulveris]BBY78853.1 hypothetical protein MPUL_00110 [Mycolicibacterium pulveris]
MTSAPRWEPDDPNLAEVVLSAPRAPFKMTALADLDRSWLVAGLSEVVLGEAGLTAEEIAERTGCCLRLVRTIRASDATKVAEYAQVRNRVLDDELRVERINHAATRRELADAQCERDRLRAQLAQILDKLQTGTLGAFPRCGHPKVRYNTYEYGGRVYCRQCRRDWDTANRKPKTASSERESVKGNGNSGPARERRVRLTVVPSAI